MHDALILFYYIKTRMVWGIKVNEKRYAFFKAKDYFSLRAIIGYQFALILLALAPDVHHDHTTAHDVWMNILPYWIGLIVFFFLFMLANILLGSILQRQDAVAKMVIFTRSTLIGPILFGIPANIVLFNIYKP